MILFAEFISYIFHPMLFFLSKKVGLFTDLDLSTREERHTFYLLVGILSIIYISISVLFKGIFFPLSIITLGVLFGIVLFELIDYYFKASVHLGVACAWVLAIILIYGREKFFAVIWIIPLLAWSRVTLKKHTPREIVIGGTVGIFVTLITFIIGKQFYK